VITAIHVILCLFLSFPASDTPEKPGAGTNAFSVTFADAATAIRKALDVDLSSLPSQNEVFFITSDLPHGRYRNDKARRLLGWEPQDKLVGYYTKPIIAAKL
jgi:nucleoside-diphosphate-sugar epimerase